MACIGDASRFRLVQALLDGARCVTDLATEVGLSQSCTTRHLQALEKRRVVCGARDGKRVMYRLCHEEPGLGPLLAWALSPEGMRTGTPAPAARRSSRPGPRRTAGTAARSPAGPPARQPTGSPPRRERSIRGPRPAQSPSSPSQALADADVAPGTGNGQPSQPPPEEPAATLPDRYELEDYLL